MKITLDERGAVDHEATARQYLHAVGELNGQDTLRVEAYTRIAQTHATLAQVEVMGDIAHSLRTISRRVGVMGS